MSAGHRTLGSFWAEHPEGPVRRDAWGVSQWIELAALSRLPSNRRERRRLGRQTSLAMGKWGRRMRKDAHYTKMTLGQRYRLVRKNEAALAVVFGEDR